MLTDKHLTDQRGSLPHICDAMQAGLEMFPGEEQVAVYELVRLGQLVLRGHTAVQFASKLHAEYFLFKDRSPAKSLKVQSSHRPVHKGVHFLIDCWAHDLSETSGSGCAELHPP